MEYGGKMMTVLVGSIILITPITRCVANQTKVTRI